MQTAAAAAASAEIAPGASVWSRDHVALLADAILPEAPLIDAAALRPLIPGLWLWDFWPVQELDGRTAAFGKGALWMALAAKAAGAPVERHGRARIRLLWRVGEDWTDLGDALPGGFSPGSREWSGSAIVDAGHERVTLFFTAAGRRGERRLTFEQRLFHCAAAVGMHGGVPRLGKWSAPVQSVASDGDLYHSCTQEDAAIGTGKAFRDPYFFRDPADGGCYLLFAASLGRSQSAFNGAVGIARADDAALERWTLLAPLVAADGLNNELERPHMIADAQGYRLYWSTQHHVFAPNGPIGPTALYGMQAASLGSPLRPVGGHGLVLCNPLAAPEQAYSWTIDPSGEATSFADMVGSKFAGTLAPSLRISAAG